MSRHICARPRVALTTALRAGIVSIDFNDGVAGTPIGNFYSGVTFSNGSWEGPVPVNQSGTASAGLVLADIFDTGFASPFSPNASTPIVAVFDVPVSSVSVVEVNVGVAGSELDAYDSASGGKLIGSDVVHTASSSGCCGAAFAFNLVVSGANIRRIRIYQPTPTVGNGIFFDNFSFTTVATAEPVTPALLLAGVILLPRMRHRRSPADGR